MYTAITVQENHFRTIPITREINHHITQVTEEDHQNEEIHKILHKIITIDQIVETTTPDQIQIQHNFFLDLILNQTQEINTTQTINHETHHIIEIETIQIIEIEVIRTTEIRITRTIDQEITHITDQTITDQTIIIKTDHETIHKIDIQVIIIDIEIILNHHIEIITIIELMGDVVNSSLHLPLKPDAVFKKQRASKVPIHLHDKVNRLLDILEQYKIISPVNKEEQPKGNTFINPVIILAKGESLKIVLDARYLNSLIDESKCIWPIEPIQVILTKINGKYFTTADMNSAYNQMPLDEQSRRLTQFVIGNQQYEFNCLFYGISIGPAAFSAFMSKIFRPLILKKKAITYLDDVFMQSQTKEEMFTVLEHYHKILQNENLKAAPDKSHFFLTRVKFLGHNRERKTITPLKSRIDAIQKLQPTTNKKKIQEFLGMLNFLSKYVYKMQLYLRPFYNILSQQNNFEWNTEHQTRFEEIKKLLTEQISNTIPDPNQPFYAMCDASNFGIGTALLQSHNGTNKMNLISANSRLFTQAELRLSTLMRECTAIIYTPTEYEFLILGSKHPTVLFTDHKPIIFLFTQKSNPNHQVYRFQLILMKFPNLHIVWTAGKNLALPDTLSRNTPPELLTRKTTVEIPKNIKFYLAENETSPRLECKYALKTDVEQSQINNL